MRRAWFFVLAGLGVFTGLTLAAIGGTPRVTGFSPSAQGVAVSGLSRVAITFSTPMDPRSVESQLTIEPPTAGRMTWEGNTLVFLPQEPWPAGTVVRVRLSAGALSVRRLPLLRAHEWSFATSGPRVAYLWPAGSPAQVYARAAVGAESIPLTDSPLGVYDFAVALNGQALVYAAEREDGGTDIWLHEMRAGPPRMLYACGSGLRCRAPRLSADGSFLAFEQFALMAGSVAGMLPGPTRVWVLDVRQGGKEPYPIGLEGRVTSAPSWSSQGLLVYYDSTLRAFVLVDPAQGPEPPPYRYFPSEVGGSAVWSPDGAYLVYPDMVFPVSDFVGESETSPALFYSHLFHAAVATGAVEDLWRGGTDMVEDASPAISPDGSWIAFARKYLEADRWTLGRQLWLMHSDGSGAHALSDDPDFHHSALAWSPDSEWLAYMRFNEATPTEAAEIWLIRRNGEGKTRLAVGGYLPQWIP